MSRIFADKSQGSGPKWCQYESPRRLRRSDVAIPTSKWGQEHKGWWTSPLIQARTYSCRRP